MKAEAALRRALVAAFAGADVTATIENIRSESWASATFSGTRHEVSLGLPGLSGCALLADLGEREFDLQGHVLIDIAVTETAVEEDRLRVRLEALTIVAD